MISKHDLVLIVMCDEMSGNLVRLTKAEMERCVKLLVDAFWDDPLNLYFIPEGENRRRMFHGYLKFRTRFAFLYGEIYSTSPNLEGIAAWFPPGMSDLTYFRLIRSGGLGLIRLLGLGTISRMNRLASHAAKSRKQHLSEPHWHLFPIAVDPQHQGKGYASALMKPMLDRIQSEGLPCFLETQNEKNVSIYQHFGFEVIYEEEFPEAEIPNWGMVRSPIP
ncbi:MAG: GNAT family N-acetyltransferase [Candidatus Thorarchaeota archaeon]|jgi:ribosomal protein S18 acetylase RimI-like enzyme